MTIAPLRNKSVEERPWEGSCDKKPWEYKVTAAIPVLDTYESLKICIDILKLQTVKPYIVVIDTGSEKENFDKIMSLASEDVEVHSLRLNGVHHPSDFPAMAMDLAQSVCRTEYMFATHADVFLMKRNFIEYLLEYCGCHLENKFPVVGYEISPRQHDDWVGMVSHTASMYHIKTMDKIGFGWSMRRLASLYDIKDYTPNPTRPNWPDTEILGNVILRQYDLPVKLIGKEDNFQRNKDNYIDHCRSLTSGLLYSPQYYKQVSSWLKEAKEQALSRIDSWQKEINEERISK